MKPRSMLIPLLLWASCTLAETTMRNGTYTVPTPFENLPYASLELPEVTWEVNAPKIKVTYKLPAQLVGPNAKAIVLEGTRDDLSDIVVLKGMHGEAHCISDQAKNFTCIIKFIGLGETLPAAENFIKEKYKSKKLVEKRVEIARAFSGDPIGVLQIRKK